MVSAGLSHDGHERAGGGGFLGGFGDADFVGPVGFEGGDQAGGISGTRD